MGVILTSYKSWDDPPSTHVTPFIAIVFFWAHLRNGVALLVSACFTMENHEDFLGGTSSKKKIPTEKQGLFKKKSGDTGCLTLTIGCVHVGCVVDPPRLLGL